MNDQNTGADGPAAGGTVINHLEGSISNQSAAAPATGNKPAPGPAPAAGNKPVPGPAPAAAGKPASGNDQVPIDVLTKMRDEMKTLKNQNQMMANQLQLYQANQHYAPASIPTNQAGAAGGTPNQTKVDPLEAIKDLKDTDVVTVGDVKGIVAALQPSGSADPDPALTRKIAVMEVQLADRNYEQTIRKYLPKIIEQTPGVSQLIQKSENPLMTALTYAHLNPQYIADKNAETQHNSDGVNTPPGATNPVGQPNNDLQTEVYQINANMPIMDQVDQIIANSNKPGAPEAVGGGGAISHADQISTMSNKEFDEHMNKVIFSG